MDQLFLLQLIISFFVGGGFVALLSFLAERLPRDIAGFVLSLPSTQAIALFFMGWTLGVHSIAEAMPAIPFGMGISLLFVTIYVYVAQYALSKPVSVLISSMSGFGTWLALGLPVVLLNIQSMALSLVAYGALALTCHYLLSVRPQVSTQAIQIRYTLGQKLFRMLVAGSLTSGVVFLGKTLGPLWGGLFSIFPAAYFSTLLLLHMQHGHQFLFHTSRTLPLASPTFILYPFVASYSFPAFGIWWGSVTSYLVAIAYLCVVRKMSISPSP